MVQFVGPTDALGLVPSCDQVRALGEVHRVPDIADRFALHIADMGERLADRDAEVRRFRYEAFERIVEGEFAGIAQGKHRHCDEGLGVARDVELGVGIRGDLGTGQVGRAHPGEPQQPAPPRDSRGQARHPVRGLLGHREGGQLTACALA